MVKAGGEALESLATTMDSDDAKLKEEYKQKGIKVYELSALEKEQWIKAQAAVKDNWIADMKSKSLPGKDVLDKLYAGVEKVRAGK